ncbi:MAG: hypothetical protein A2Z14_04315 [Chloroflexi bacterium RBG_16_48_8]|nr:MAG: hypothetical protein A2Z14_04315 [Chloroflexi bacterium RBG_16_48_8]
MSSVVVTIKDGRGGRRDLELPADVPVSTLGPAIAQAVHHPDLPTDETPVKAVLKVEGSQEVIPPDESLQAAGVVHGDVLLIMVKVIPSDLSQEDVSLRFSGPGLVHPSGKTYPFLGKSVLIGRVDRASGVVPKVLGVDLTDLEDIEGPSVSRRHAQVLFRNGDYLIQDLRSTNGTTINGQLLPPQIRLTLHHGDKVQIGDIPLFFIWDSQEGDLVLNGHHPIEKEGQE